MKQILQSLKTGKTELVEIPIPSIEEGSVLIQSQLSLVSSGTEKMLIDFGKSNILKKIKNNRSRVQEVFRKISDQGLLPTLNLVKNKLDSSIPLGYSNVGVIVKAHSSIKSLKVGDRVVSNGPHAEYVLVKENLVSKIPDSVSNEDASFAILGSIALNGVRLLNPSLGEFNVVVGLGLIGQLTCQLLKANGCEVIGVDIDQNKVNIASQLGIDTINSNDSSSLVDIIKDKNNGYGADGVIIAASSKSNQIISNSAKIVRKRGKIILVGVVGMNINRDDFYKKEISFQVACSYGPGRYDPQYEIHGNDYPISYVRWTEKRNFETILNLFKNSKINTESLISNRVKLKNYNRIYDDISSNNTIANLIEYENNNYQCKNHTIAIFNKNFKKKNCVIGLIGSGNFTKVTVLPLLSKIDAEIKYLSSINGVSSTQLSKKYKIPFSTTDYQEILNDKEVNTIFINTRHNLHKQIIVDCLKKNKNIFVEKPLCLSVDELKEILQNYKSNSHITVGYNRRFSPHSKKVKEIITKSDSLMNLTMTMNAGSLPDNHWAKDYKISGGRIIGEACHLIDLVVFFSGSLIKSVCANWMGNSYNQNNDNLSILLKLHNGSNASINYFANGSSTYSKEKIQIYQDKKVYEINDFKITKAYGDRNFKTYKTKMDKGHYFQFFKYIDSINNGFKTTICINEIINVSQASFAIIESMQNNEWVDIVE